MTDKEKIIAYIDKLLEKYPKNYYLLTVAEFIDTLQEEPVSNPIDFEQELYKAFGQVKDFTLGMRIAKWFYDMGKNSQEPVGEDLEKAARSYTNNIDNICGSVGEQTRNAFKAGAQWKLKQDQSTIELAEDHAMLAGMEKMKEQIMTGAIETTFNVSLPSSLYDKLWIKGCKEGDKLLVIKKD